MRKIENKFVSDNFGACGESYHKYMYGTTYPHLQCG